MARKTKVLAVSVPPDVARDYERLVRRERTNRSELFRRMIESYRAQADLANFKEVQAMTSAAANRGRKKPLTEAEVEKILARA